MTIFTADVSSWDGLVDWGRAAQAGIAAACVKASEGGGPRYRYTNPAFPAQFHGAAPAGMELVGAYHCLSGDDVNQQISYFIQAYAGSDPNYLGPFAWFMLDVEPFDELRHAQALPDFGHLEQFTQAWHDQGRGPLALYLPQWVWEQWGSPSLTGLAGTIRLISSRYPTGTRYDFRAGYDHAGGDTGPGWAPYGGLTPTLWQYTSSALIPGIRGGTAPVDANAFRGTLPELVQLLTSAAAPAPTPTGGDDMITHWSSVARGARGEQVRIAQGLLIAHQLGVGSDDGRPDGDFGPTTEQSTRNLQIHYGIGVDGIFGPKTLSCALYGRVVA